MTGIEMGLWRRDAERWWNTWTAERLSIRSSTNVSFALHPTMSQDHVWHKSGSLICVAHQAEEGQSGVRTEKGSDDGSDDMTDRFCPVSLSSAFRGMDLPDFAPVGYIAQAPPTLPGAHPLAGSRGCFAIRS